MCIYDCLVVQGNLVCAHVATDVCETTLWAPTAFEAKQRFIGHLRERFNSVVRYNCRLLKLDTVIELKALELGRYLASKSQSLDFEEPVSVLERIDSAGLRAQILALKQIEAKKLGIGKSTFHYLRKRARDKQPLRIYRKVANRMTPARGMAQVT